MVVEIESPDSNQTSANLYLVGHADVAGCASASYRVFSPGKLSAWTERGSSFSLSELLLAPEGVFHFWKESSSGAARAAPPTH
jgi:hypothetical protein